MILQKKRIFRKKSHYFVKAGDRANDDKNLVFVVKCYFWYVVSGPGARFAIVTRFLGVFNSFSSIFVQKSANFVNSVKARG